MDRIYRDKKVTLFAGLRGATMQPLDYDADEQISIFPLRGSNDIIVSENPIVVSQGRGGEDDEDEVLQNITQLK